MLKKKVCVECRYSDMHAWTASIREHVTVCIENGIVSSVTYDSNELRADKFTLINVVSFFVYPNRFLLLLLSLMSSTFRHCMCKC